MPPSSSDHPRIAYATRDRHRLLPVKRRNSLTYRVSKPNLVAVQETGQLEQFLYYGVLY